MLHYEASIAGLAERYGRGETSHTIHVYWARRPHSAMRSVVFAALCKIKSRATETLLKQLGRSSIVDTSILDSARTLLKRQYSSPPKLLDMFGGGGTIPIEAANLGAEVYAVDSNELSVFIQRSNLVYSQELRSDIADTIKASGIRVISNLASETEALFPLRNKWFGSSENQSPFAYLWTYSYLCDKCGYRFFLSKRPWLSKKYGKNLAVVLENGVNHQSTRVQAVPDGFSSTSAWCGKNGTVRCPRCSYCHCDIDIRKCRDELVAMVKAAGELTRAGKYFLPATSEAVPGEKYLEQMERDLLGEVGVDLPNSILPRWSGIVNPALYGIETHSDFLNRRQRLVLLLLVKALQKEWRYLKKQQGEIAARFIIATLSSLIDQLVDWNCRLSMWIPQNEQVGRAFCGPGVSMLWDYAETDPVLRGPANLWSKLERIVAGARSLPRSICRAHIEKASAQKLPFASEVFDAIVTDPPYYDNIFYTVLANFFYSWKRMVLKPLDPTLFAQEVTDDSDELVASRFRSGSFEGAHESYCIELSLALKEAARVLKSDGVFCFVYSHGSVKGWEALVRAYRSTEFRITGVEPLSVERRQRPRAMTSEAVNTCITFVAHKCDKPKGTTSLAQLCETLRRIQASFVPRLCELGWKDSDAGLAAFANGVALLANSDYVEKTDDLTALRAIEGIVRELIPSFLVKDRKSL